MELTYLLTEAEIMKGCGQGLDQLRNCKTIDDMIQCYFDNIDFCLANNFPSNEFLMQYREELRDAGVFIDEKADIESRPRLVFLGQSECILSIDKYAVSRVYVKHDSILKVKASNNSVIMIDALDNAVIEVEQSDNARAIVNLYAKAKCTVTGWNTRIIHKNRFTYEL